MSDATVTTTFVFTDIEDSSGLWEREPEAMTDALHRHDDLLAEVVTGHGGQIFKHTGDGVGALFPAARNALAAAVDAQTAMNRETWPTSTPIRVRIGIHTGEAQPRGGDYHGSTVNRVARVCDLGRGGSVLVTAATHLLTDGRLPPECELRHVADVNLRGMAVAEAIYQLHHPELPSDTVVLRTSDVLHAVGPETGTLVGRSSELRAIADALGKSRLVTLTGLGGVGKTSLAATVARTTDVVDAERVWWVDLIAAADDDVAHAIADAVGVGSAGASPLSAVAQRLGSNPALLVLDNCEQVVDAVSASAGALLGDCPELRILATSRMPFGASQERTLSIAPLAPPPHGATAPGAAPSPAVELFVRRAREASPSFRLDDVDTGTIDELCRRLDGLPLALELAAARVRSLSPRQILDHLDERFRLLRSTRTDADDRHGSLEAVVAWSFDTLRFTERATLARLSVFMAPFSLDAIVEVAGGDELDLLDVLDVLVSRAMVDVVEQRTSLSYRLPETIRAFANDRLRAAADHDDVVARHRRLMLRTVEKIARELDGPGEPEATALLGQVLPDVNTAFSGARRDGDVDASLRFAIGLYENAFRHMRGDVARWTLEAVALEGATDHDRFGEAAGAAAFLAWQIGDLDEARRWSERGMAAGDSWLATAASALVAQFVGDLTRHDELSDRALEIARREGNRAREATTLGRLAFSVLLGGEPRAAAELAHESLTIASTTRNPTAMAHAHWAVGVAHTETDPGYAIAELDHCLELAHSVDNRLAISSAESSAHELRGVRGPTIENVGALVRRLETTEDHGRSPATWYDVRLLGRLLARMGAPEAAAIAFGAEAAAPLKVPPRPREQASHEAAVAGVRSALGAHRFDAACGYAAALSFEELVAELRSAIEEIDVRVGSREN